MNLLSSYGPSVFWLIALIVFLVVEAATVGLTAIWFGAGSLAALIASFAIRNIWFEILTFLVVSFFTLLAVRPMAKRFMVPRRQATNADRAIGREGVVLEDIDNLHAQGTVSVAGVLWTARSQNDTLIPKDSKVLVKRIEGVKLFVLPAEAPVSAGEKKEEE